ncbi:MAG: MBL fold metallo-hydrolase [Actinobacteria bacterium]|nr:MBL fold metallo-hydrolase [Actinomycetota bacterium]
MPQTRRSHHPGGPHEIAEGVYLLEVGKGLMRSNVYFVGSGSSWVLIDAASAGHEQHIQEAAASLFGAIPRPQSILLTHSHPDHAGSARALARRWDCPVYLHPAEMPMASGDIAQFRPYANPLDRWLVFPLLRLMGRRRSKAILAAASFADVTRPLSLSAEPPGLPDWQAVPTTGHTPGHVAFFREPDGVLVAGDALVTVDLNSPLGFLVGGQRVSGPPWYTTWNRSAAKSSVARLAGLEPYIVAGGHGLPISGPDTATRVHEFSARFSRGAI